MVTYTYSKRCYQMMSALGSFSYVEKGAHCKGKYKLSLVDEVIGQNNNDTHPSSQT